MAAICEATGKMEYRSKEAARTAIKELKQANKTGYGFLHEYRCGGHWHIGHGSKTRKKGRRFRL